MPSVTKHLEPVGIHRLILDNSALFVLMNHMESAEGVWK